MDSYREYLIPFCTLFLFNKEKRETNKEDQEFESLEKRQQITGELEIGGHSKCTVSKTLQFDI